MTARRDKALANAQHALQRLQSFLSEPVRNDRDMAGVIQAFEFTFETVWKLLQKLADEQGLSAPSPRRAIAAGYRLGICADEDLWLGMLDDRNSTSHTYNESEALRIFERIRDHHATALADAVARGAALRAT